MKTMPFEKYRPFPRVAMPDRTWPSKMITRAPAWCSVDLRDGNQALITPMSVDQKLEMFGLLVKTGFKEIEVGFPSACETEFSFIRALIEGGHIPDDVSIQVLTQAREHLIRKTFKSLNGCQRAIVHLYNSTSELQRRVVFRMEREEIVALAVRGAELIRHEAERNGDMDVIYEYSPESFTGTEPDFALEICKAVMDVWEPTPDRKVTINLPATVEMATPNVYADQIEWFSRNVSRRDSILISAHAHNDRGTAVAATELALLAGAERVEGTLFGNGERTGNVDIVTLALNLFSQGIDSHLVFSDINSVIEMYERCTGLTVHSRHPYAGELVYTAFSGSHQDAINKGMKEYSETSSSFWEVPYLPIDPADVGRSFEAVIRINSQSGKGGVAYVMEQAFGYRLPKEMHPEFGAIIKALSDSLGRELSPDMINEAFDHEYLRQKGLYALRSVLSEGVPGDVVNGISPEIDVCAIITINGEDREISGRGNGPVDAFSNAMQNDVVPDFRLVSYYEHALGAGSDSKAAAYVQLESAQGYRFWGAGVNTNIEIASFKAIISALNRMGSREVQHED